MQAETAVAGASIEVAQPRLEAASAIGDFDDDVLTVVPATQRHDRSAAVFGAIRECLSDGVLDVGERSVRKPARNPVEQKMARK